VVGNIAALVAHKGQRHLVDAAPAIVRARPDAQILIFGEGELRPVLQRQIKHLGLDHHVKLVGFQPDILSLLGGLDVFVMSSLTEGLGTSILDAMAASRAVVATTAGGIPEIVVEGETGLLVRPGHAAPLAEAIISLLGAPERRQAMGAAGLARVREHFTVERMVDLTLALYERVAGRRRAAGSASPLPGS